MTRPTLVPLALSLLVACTPAAREATGAASEVARQAVDTLVAPAWAEGASTGFDRIPDVAERVVPAVVNIRADGKPRPSQAETMVPFPFGPFGMDPRDGMPRHAEGSGVIVSARGLVLTNHHVIDGADRVEITLADGRRLPAKVKGDDPATDLALLEIEGEVPKNLPALAFGDSDALRLGEVVLAIGSPFGLQSSVTLGIVSARGRSGFDLARYEDFIQTDAAINPGNSGGALVDLHGNLVGINAAIRSQTGGSDGIGFAIPSNLAKQIMDRLLRDGKVVRGYLGVGIDDVDPTRAEQFALGADHGALVTEVGADTPAARAGLQPYDVIVALDGQRVDDANALRHRIALAGAGTKVDLDVVRGGASQRLSAKLGELDAEGRRGGGTPEGGPEGPDADGLAGVRMVPLDDQVRQQLRLDAREVPAGVLVLAVEPGSDAARAGLGRGDVVLEVDRTPVSTPKEVARAVGKDGKAMLLVLRQGARRIVFLD